MLDEWTWEPDRIPISGHDHLKLYMGGTAPEDDMLTGLRWSWGPLGDDWSGPRVGPDDFDSVITLYSAAAPADWGVLEQRYGFMDGPLYTETLSTIHALADWGAQRLEAGDRLLVRCQQGWNRSGLVTALILLRFGVSGADAVETIRAARSEWCLCNRDFEEYLLSAV